MDNLKRQYKKTDQAIKSILKISFKFDEAEDFFS